MVEVDFSYRFLNKVFHVERDVYIRTLSIKSPAMCVNAFSVIRRRLSYLFSLWLQDDTIHPAVVVSCISFQYGFGKVRQHGNRYGGRDAVQLITAAGCRKRRHV